MCPQGVSAQVYDGCATRCPTICIQHKPRKPYLYPTQSYPNRLRPRCPTICIQQNPSESLSESLCRPSDYPMSTQCRPKADPMPTQCRPWRHKLIKFAFSGELWKGQNEARFAPFKTKIGSLKSSSRDLSNGSL